MKNREETKIRADRAQRSIVENIGKLVAKHIIGMLGGGQGASFDLHGTITAEGIASVSLEYTATVKDGVGFKLDDAQLELAPPPAAPDAGTGKEEGATE